MGSLAKSKPKTKYITKKLGNVLDIKSHIIQQYATHFSTILTRDLIIISVTQCKTHITTVVLTI